MADRQQVKRWVVNHAAVTKPYDGVWYAAVTIGYDYNGAGESIEKAYNKLTDKIFNSPFIMAQLENYNSFKQQNI